MPAIVSGECYAYVRDPADASALADQLDALLDEERERLAANPFGPPPVPCDQPWLRLRALRAFAASVRLGFLSQTNRP
jgi:hypothetical protein